PPHIYTLSLHDALPIFNLSFVRSGVLNAPHLGNLKSCLLHSNMKVGSCPSAVRDNSSLTRRGLPFRCMLPTIRKPYLRSMLDPRSEEHTSELQSLAYLV